MRYQYLLIVILYVYYTHIKADYFILVCKGIQANHCVCGCVCMCAYVSVHVCGWNCVAYRVF